MRRTGPAGIDLGQYGAVLARCFALIFQSQTLKRQASDDYRPAASDLPPISWSLDVARLYQGATKVTSPVSTSTDRRSTLISTSARRQVTARLRNFHPSRFCVSNS